MNDNTAFVKDLIQSSSREIEKSDEINFYDLYKPYEGTPQKHPYDKTKVIILTEPFSDCGIMLEFPYSSIGKIDEYETVTSDSGKTAVL
ncbi:MAG: hypothetical protein ACRCUT_06400, partial [Spirochaetota bacterium]